MVAKAATKKTVKTAPKQTVKKSTKKAEASSKRQPVAGEEAAVEAKMRELLQKRGAASTC